MRKISSKTQLFIDMLPGSTVILPSTSYDIPRSVLERRGMRLSVTTNKKNNTKIVTKVC
jgi:hypothetical protein